MCFLYAGRPDDLSCLQMHGREGGMRRAARMIFNKVRGIYEYPVLEESIVQEIQVRLGYAGIPTFRIRERIPGRWKPSTAGIPDLIGWIPQLLWWKNSLTGEPAGNGPAVPLFIECKRPKGAHRPSQTAFIAKAEGDGALAFFADSWQVVRERLSLFGIELP